MDTAELKGTIESLLFASAEPLVPERLAEILEIDLEDLETVLAEMEEHFRQGHGLLLERVAGGLQFRTRPEHGEWVRRLHRSRPFRFSRAALETLAIIAYRQPITRAEVEYLRGVDSGGVLKTLMEKHLVRILGKKDSPGRPMIYGTTRGFLELFGLRDLACLPTLKEFGELSAGSGLEGEGTTPSLFETAETSED
ncbi:MAG: SMC-Scp complex subunit ScpB [Desulfuromonas sp.]|uniref:SMC-Scp complex subunit ScpB n=1 Tax=Desulfuromonas sp. TaxID=892 RepID=UPI000CB5460B|nr:SMC-Scp complex subunit ScpB [Desulfuromonas sp.]PLX84712.1 MAG: SMC-Scp complex subunit ScpB [Desulfuromonas sp.]